MKKRLEALKRLEAMYELIEELHLVALRRTTATMHETEAAITVQVSRLKDARSSGRDALDHGDRVSWEIAEVQRDVAAQKRDQLEVVRVECATAAELAREMYRKSHLQHEQMKNVVKYGIKVEKVEEDRRTQATADDRFLSRLHWNRLCFEAD